ncbi:MAG: choice-of-anchor D domain-containing protein [Pseudomonadota bacterium]
MKAHWILSALWVAGCGASPDPAEGWTPSGPGAPSITLDPTWLDFGTVAATDPAAHTLTVRIDNDGDGDLRLQGFAWGTASAPFVLGGPATLLVEPGESTSLQVTFDPILDGTHRATLAIDSDDPWRPTVRLPVQAEGLAPSLAVDSPLDFGAVALGCAAEAPLFLHNTGSLDLTVTDIAWLHQDPAFTSPDTSILPIVIAPGARASLDFAFEPRVEGAAQAILAIASDDPAEPVIEVTAAGAGEIEEWTMDTFTQRRSQPADVLIAVKSDPAMEPYALADQLAAFATEAITAYPNAHITVTVTDDGCPAVPWIDAATADIPAAVADMLASTPGSNSERAFMLLEAALAETGPGGCNEGFLREESRLMLVGVSDEPDQSVNPWSYYVTVFQSYRDDPDDVLISAVGGDYPGGCGDAVAYTGMYEAHVATGGLFLSLCTPHWGLGLVPIAAATDGTRDRFHLAHEPVPATIAVTVGGSPETRWSYAEATREVIFEPAAIPEEGAEIAISYAVAGHCGG